MPIESLTYAEIADRLGVSPEAARKKMKSLRFPTSLGNDGKVRVSVDFADIRHTPRPARRTAGGHPDDGRTVPLKEMHKLIDDLRVEIGRRSEDTAGILEEQRGKIVELESQNAVLEVQLAGAQTRIELLREQLDDVKAGRDVWQRYAEALSQRIPEPAEPQPDGGWFGWFRRK